MLNATENSSKVRTEKCSSDLAGKSSMLDLTRDFSDGSMFAVRGSNGG